MAILKPFPGAITTVMSGAQINGLANGGVSVGDVIDNTISRLFTVYIELTVPAYAGAASPVAGQPISVYFIKAPDGSTYEQGNTGTLLPPVAEYVFPTQAAADLLVVSHIPLILPYMKLKPKIHNGSGLQFGAAGCLVRILGAQEEF